MKCPISPTIGILSSLGLRGTGAFIDLVAQECRLQYGARHDSDFPRLLISSQPVGAHDAAQEILRHGLRQLERAGADFIAIASDAATAHFSALSESAGVRVLNPVDLMLEAIPLSAQKLALVATRPVVETEVFQRALWRGGHRLIDQGWQQEVDALVDAVAGNDAHRLAQRWGDFLGHAGKAEVDTVLLSCFGLGRVAAESGTTLHIIDGARCLARGAVAEWLAWCVEE